MEAHLTSSQTRVRPLCPHYGVVSGYCSSYVVYQETNSQNRLTDAKAAKECGTYFEKLLNMLSKITDLLSQFSIYDALFRGHERVVAAVSRAFLDIFQFFTEAKSVLRRGRGVCGSNQHCLLFSA